MKRWVFAGGCFALAGLVLLLLDGEWQMYRQVYDLGKVVTWEGSFAAIPAGWDVEQLDPSTFIVTRRNARGPEAVRFTCEAIEVWGPLGEAVGDGIGDTPPGCREAVASELGVTTDELGGAVVRVYGAAFLVGVLVMLAGSVALGASRTSRQEVAPSGTALEDGESV